MDTNNNQDKQLKKLRRRINFYFYSVVVGTVLAFASSVSLQTLQTSINIEGNVGSIGLTAAFFGSVAYSLFVAPVTMQRFGAGFCLIVADLCFLIYCASNYYPKIYILVPGSLVSSVGRSLLLPSTAIASFQLAEQFNRCGSKDEAVYLNRFQSRFISMFSTVSIIGNTIAFASLFASQTDSKNEQLESMTTTTVTYTTYTGMNLTSTNPSLASNRSKYYYCGANDCQDPDVVGDNIDQYVPPDQISTIILVSTACSISFIAFLIHAFIYPGIGKFGHKLYHLDRNITNFLNPDASSTSLQFVANGESDSTKVNEIFAISNENNSYTNAGFVTDSDKTHNQYNSSNLRRDSSLTKENTRQNSIASSDRDGYWTTLKSTGKFFIRPQAILIGFTPMRNGIIIGFIFGDITRSYASCVAGVQLTGLIATTYGAAGIVVSLLYGHVVKYTGRNAIMFVAFLIEMSVYVGCYVWKPDPDTIYCVYFIFIGLGAVSATLYISINVVYNEYFPTESHIATNVWNFWFQGATGLQYALSTFMCMVDKIYLGMAFLTFSAIMYAAAEFRHHKKMRRNERVMDESISMSNNL